MILEVCIPCDPRLKSTFNVPCRVVTVAVACGDSVECKFLHVCRRLASFPKKLTRRSAMAVEVERTWEGRSVVQDHPLQEQVVDDRSRTRSRYSE